MLRYVAMATSHICLLPPQRQPAGGPLTCAEAHAAINGAWIFILQHAQLLGVLVEQDAGLPALLADLDVGKAVLQAAVGERRRWGAARGHAALGAYATGQVVL